MDRQPSQLLKLLILGDAGTGKTSLANKYVLNKFSQRYRPTIGIDFLIKKLQLDDTAVSLQIWEFAGDERITDVSFYMGWNCCIIVYDVTNRNSFERVEDWRAVIISARLVKRDAFPFVLVGNKSDKEAERQVKWSEAQTWARSNGAMPLFEASTPQGYNVQEIFEEAARLALLPHSQLS